jgi:hypothetical protein
MILLLLCDQAARLLTSRLLRRLSNCLLLGKMSVGELSPSLGVVQHKNETILATTTSDIY